MTFIPLQNYIRTHRKRSHLSQDEVAFLLGTTDGTRVARHEGGGRNPTLESALAYELLFGVSMQELFPGEARKVETVIRKRLPELIRHIEEEAPAKATSQRVAFLKHLAERLAEHDKNDRRLEVARN